MKLTKEQRALVTTWAAEGMGINEVRRRARDYDPPFEVEQNQLKHIRRHSNANYLHIKEEFQAEALAEGLARKAVRIRRLGALFDEHLQLIEARGREMAGEVAGGETGLMARDYKGKDADRAVYKYDAALIREIRGLLDDIAKEMGERKTNVEVGGGELILKVQYGDDGQRTDNQTAAPAPEADRLSE